jgi:capsular polysaccharide export protein
VKQRLHLRRSFLFLQGPHGSFFPKLGLALEAGGHRVRRINLNGGDLATWPSGDDYRGFDANWAKYVAAYFTRWGITDVVLFGDSRPPHRTAIAQAKAAGVRVHVFEEGYIRPDWVTLERDGVNGNSHLPRVADWYREQAVGLGNVPVHSPLPSYATARGWAAFFYYAEVVLQHWRFPLHGSHRERNPVWEGITHLRRFRRRARDEASAKADFARISGKPYFLFPLQLNSDYQIRVHSCFGNMHSAIRFVLESFARSAPEEIALIVKEHPLDAGLDCWRDLVDEIAIRLGIRDRVAFLERGDMLQLVRDSKGIVTVNSTSGTLALAAGKPVKVLGDAVYDVAGITDQGDLESFWASPTAPDIGIWEDFYRVLANRCLIHGAFLSNIGIDFLVNVATERLTAQNDSDLMAIPASAYKYGRA